MDIQVFVAIVLVMIYAVLLYIACEIKEHHNYIVKRDLEEKEYKRHKENEQRN